MKTTRTLLLVALAGLSFAASGQWLWIDKDGHKVFSDRSPPPDILEKNILKRPGGPKPVVAAPADPTADSDATPATTAVSTPAAPLSSPKNAGIDKDLEAKKKQAKEAEAAKRKAVEDQNNKDKAENCSRAKEAKASLENGGRIARMNAAGEKVILDDAGRGEEKKRGQSIIDKECK